MPISAGQYSLDRFYEGQILSEQLDTFYKGIQEEYVNKEGAVIPYGRFVIDDGYGEIKLPYATGQDIIGFAAFQDRFARNQDGTTGIPVDQAIGVLYRGIVAVKAETALTRGSTVFIRHTDNVAPLDNESRGLVRADADGGNADELVTARVIEDVAAGEIARVRLNIDALL